MGLNRVSPNLWTRVADINRGRNTIAIHVRAIRVYEVAAFGRAGESMEVVFHDDEGIRIHCQIKKPYIERFRKQIVEGGVYGIKNLLVHQNYHSFKTTPHQYLLAFYSQTGVKTLQKEGFPEFMYDLRTFESIREQPATKDNMLLDVIGKIVGRSRVRTHITPQKEDKLLEITLEDHEGKRISCTLWGKYVDQFNEYVNLDLPFPYVMLASFCRAKRFNGEVNVSTAFDVTKIVFDGLSNEVVEFKAKLPEQGDDTTFTTTVLSGGDDADCSSLTITTIKSLLAETVEGSYWIMGEIDSLGPMRSWCYLGCTICNKKVYAEDARFKCDGCKRTIPHGVYKYKVIVRVVDESGDGHASFILFDKECTELLGVSACLLREGMLERTLDPDSIPQELDGMVCRKALFKVNVRKQLGTPTKRGTHIYTVGQMVTDPRVLDKYKEVVERTALDDLWDKVEDLSQTVKKIGSSEVFGSQSSCSSSFKEIVIEADDPIKRRLFDESSTSMPEKRFKAIKVEK